MVWESSFSVFRGAAKCLAPLAALISGLISSDPALSRDLDPAAPAIVHADVVALDQTIVYNRFGSFDPYGMIFALRRDVSAMANGGFGDEKTANDCKVSLGTDTGVGALSAGRVRLRDCKRPRPLVLRARAGDILRVNVQNLLKEPPVAGTKRQPGVSETFCRETKKVGANPNINVLRNSVSEQGDKTIGGALCDIQMPGARPSYVSGPGMSADWPRTRTLSFVIPGLEPIPDPDTSRIHQACVGNIAVEPGDSFACYFRLDREGTHLFQSIAATAGGEGDGGSLTHGLFGSLIVEPRGSLIYRSQVSMAAFDQVWPRKTGDSVAAHARAATPDYNGAVNRATPAPQKTAANPCRSIIRTPVAGMLRDCGTSRAITLSKGDGTTDTRSYREWELIHGDLNAIIVPPPVAANIGDEYLDDRPKVEPFREFAVIFHDELKTYFTKNFEELGSYEQFSGIRDGFAINYGASGAGSLVLANRKKIGPAATCPECMYEEFFLESWANGDPALLENFVDDPSNVHHSYLNDRVVFRNFHAGPKETHVFHLHSHQWFAGNDKNRGSYLDSQTIGPQQGMSYDIYGGGVDLYRPGVRPGQKGWWDTLGSGNRNRTPGDAIFHCHLYPHFAQGMWELWRVHDVLEDGTRTLPDGQKTPGLSLVPRTGAELASVRPGTDPDGGTAPTLWLDPNADPSQEGTPIPGLLPVPRQAAPLLATYDPNAGFPGYPFYIAGVTGHRTPQAPMDIAVDATGTRLDGGLGRHVITGGKRIGDLIQEGFDEEQLKQVLDVEKVDGVWTRRDKIVPLTPAQKLAIGDLTEEFASLTIQILPPDGTPLERRAMAFHHKGLIEGDPANPLALNSADGAPLMDVPGTAAGGLDTLAYKSIDIPDTPATQPASNYFAVNGAPPRPGAPFADPCGAPDRLLNADMRDPYRPASLGPAVPLWPAAYIDGLYPGYPYGNARPPEYWSKVAGGPDKFFAPSTGAAYPPREMTYDPGLGGFRRFEASVVQLDMVVNKAGWHDPQARINVLTSRSDEYKTPGRRGNEEPFYFRAFSGDCIEFRHTNETPLKLELDDFQAKVPTDTIGQHIHLVKFDVTSSDGSGNGFNYEDGTFAPDEIKERIEATEHLGGKLIPPPGQTEAKLQAAVAAWKGKCVDDKPIYARKLSENRECFQTTVQRWFADPLLSLTGEAGDKGSPRVADRTLRTVFTHDHFAPSNIQQHGFYSALLIEPSRMRATVYDNSRTAPQQDIGTVSQPPWQGVPKAGATADCVALTSTDQDYMNLKSSNPVVKAAARQKLTDFAASCTHEPVLVDADKSGQGVGAQARVVNVTLKQQSKDPMHPDFREFALAIADFALLYDGKPDTDPMDTVDDLNGGGSAKGIDRLVGEAAFNRKPWNLAGASSEASNVCEHNRGNSSISPPDAIPPAQAVACEVLEGETSSAWLEKAEAQLTAFARQKRAGYGRPVNPPDRPEAISQTHHDPYLVNYKHDPIPLRVGETDLLASRRCGDIADATASATSVDSQKSGIDGDMARVFRSEEHGDPCTPLLEAYGDERVLFRLIQGAQEVQHVFTLEGRNFRRNVDQVFAYGARLGPEDNLRSTTRWQDCMKAAEPNRPAHTAWWFNRGEGAGDRSPTWLERYRKIAAECDNTGALTSAQEIGISEHFEAAGTFSSEAGLSGEGRLLTAGQGSGDPHISALPLRDSLYHFGTVDALWNGGWGLLRTHNSAQGPDTTKCLALAQGPAERQACLDRSAAPVGVLGDRLKPLNDETARGLTGEAASPGASIRADSAIEADTTPVDILVELPGRIANVSSVGHPNLACPFIRPEDLLPRTPSGNYGGDNRTRHVFSALAAVSGRDLGANLTGAAGLAYNKALGIYDPDALLLVPIDIGALPVAKVNIAASGSDAPSQATVQLDPSGIFGLERIGSVGSDGRNGVLDRAAALAAVRAEVRLRGAVPSVQRMNAGECMHLVVVNLLKNDAQQGRVAGLRDDPGDAIVPKITNLNVDQYNLGSKGVEERDSSTGDLSPSASLALTIPLTTVSNVNDLPDPVGANPRSALDPASGNDVPFTIMTLFGGTIGYLDEQVDRAVSSIVPETLSRRSFLKGASATCDAAAVSLLGQGQFDTLRADIEAARTAPDERTALSARLEEVGREIDGLDQVVRPSMSINYACRLPTLSEIPRSTWDGTIFRPASLRFGIQGGTYSGSRYVVWPAAYRPCESEEFDFIDLNVLGRRYCTITELSTTPGQPGAAPSYQEVEWEIRQRLVTALKANDQAELRVVARAYGALPIKSMGDIISHGTHGLAGSLIVEPASAVYASAVETNAAIDPPAGQPAPSVPIGWTMVTRDRTATAPSLQINVAKTDLPDAVTCTNPASCTPMADYPAPASIKAASIAERSLLWQDGLNLWDNKRPDMEGIAGADGGPIPDCAVCDDSYDRGEMATGYVSTPLFARVRGRNLIPSTIGPDMLCSAGGKPIYHGGPDSFASTCDEDLRSVDLSSRHLPSNLLTQGYGPVHKFTVPPDQEISIRIVHPQGRARQRAFVPLGASYQDMIPGFGSGHSTLIAPGKGVTASMRAPSTIGDYPWFDGPRQIMSGGSWGVMEVKR